MINGCVKGINGDDCGCACHRVPGMVHVFPCCDKPPASRSWSEQTIIDILDGKTFDRDRDPGDESEAE